jgi:hypothetical protein
MANDDNGTVDNLDNDNGGVNGENDNENKNNTNNVFQINQAKCKFSWNRLPSSTSAESIRMFSHYVTTNNNSNLKIDHVSCTATETTSENSGVHESTNNNVQMIHEKYQIMNENALSFLQFHHGNSSVQSTTQPSCTRQIITSTTSDDDVQKLCLESNAFVFTKLDVRKMINLMISVMHISANSDVFNKNNQIHADNTEEASSSNVVHHAASMLSHSLQPNPCLDSHSVNCNHDELSVPIFVSRLLMKQLNLYFVT